MIADTDLPVWSFRPNWAQGITERLSWLTDILASSYGPEQRRALRLSPRREFEMTFNPVDSVRSYFDLFLHRLGSLEFMVPLFHDQGRLSAAIVAGATAIPFDTTYREFAVGDLAILIGGDAFTFDKVMISDVTDAGITVLAGGVTRAWPKGSSIFPLRRTRISQESMFSAMTNRVGEATLEFQLNQANDIPDEGEWDATYGDYPILLDKPNRRENLDLSYIRNSLLLDNDHGLAALADDAGRAFTISTNSYMMKGRAEHWAMRQMLYRLRGAQGSIWVPSFNRDFELSRDRLAADAVLDIKQIGYGYTGGAVSGRRHVLISGAVTGEVTATDVPLAADEERLTLAAPLGVGLPAGAYGSFLETCRLSDDTIEIAHHTDTDGAGECQLNFRSFRDERVPPTITEYPIPVTDQSDDACGEPAPEEAICFVLPETGFWGELTFEWASDDLTAPPTQGAGINITVYDSLVGGSILAQASSISNAGTWTRTLDETGRVTGQKLQFGANRWPADPFAAYGGEPPRIHAQIQFPAFTVPLHADHSQSKARAYWRLPDGDPIPLVPSVSYAGGDPNEFAIYSLWPIYQDFTF